MQNIRGSELPEPCLLVHHKHMTVDCHAFIINPISIPRLGLQAVDHRRSEGGLVASEWMCVEPMQLIDKHYHAIHNPT